MEEYVSDAASFRPERWIKQTSGCPASKQQKSSHIHPFASLPYGHGARMCLGRRFADLEIQVLLAKVYSSVALPVAGQSGH
jgi:cytochrome P450